MDLMSPNDLNEDRKRWLDIPHDLHESILGLMQKLFPEFNLDGIHCFECEGMKPQMVILKDNLMPKLCVGYVDINGEVLMSLRDIPKEGGDDNAGSS